MSVASLIVGVLAILMAVLAIALAYSLGASMVQQLGSDFTMEEVQQLAQDRAFWSSAIGVTVTLLASPVLGLIGLILGIVGVAQEGKRPTTSGKALGIVGIVVSLLPLLCCVTLLLIGLAGNAR